MENVTGSREDRKACLRLHSNHPRVAFTSEWLSITKPVVAMPKPSHEQDSFLYETYVPRYTGLLADRPDGISRTPS